ncbi:MAG: DUF6089 family protein [Bacteroidota bacterium]|jgi:hypothetical protein
MKKTLAILLIVIAAIPVAAQRSNEIGLFLGGSYYTGELNPAGHLNSLTRPAAGLVFRHNFNYRFSVATSLLFGSVQGIDSRSGALEQQRRNLSFRSRMFELSARAEFNFIEYAIGNDKYSFTPFMFLGIGAFNFNPKASLGNEWIALQPLKTEGQSKGYMLTQISIPFGAGAKFNLANRIGLVVDWGLRKTFTDYIDDVSTVYADPALLLANSGPVAVTLADRGNTGGDNVGRQRGNPRNKDWYSFIGLTLSFRLVDKPVQCSGVGI